MKKLKASITPAAAATPLYFFTKKSFIKLNAIKNVYTEEERTAIIGKFIGLLQKIKILIRHLEKNVEYFKDKETDKTVKKKHEFSLDIDLMTNIVDNQAIKYSPNMTIPTTKNDAVLLFTPLINFRENIILSNITGDKDHVYTQFIEAQQFESLINRMNQLLVGMNSIDTDEYEYMYISKKLSDNQTIHNIAMVLDTFFKRNSPFFIKGQRYTVFSYEWNSQIISIFKNGILDSYDGPTYTDDDLLNKNALLNKEDTISVTSIYVYPLVAPINELLKRLNKLFYNKPPLQILEQQDILFEIVNDIFINQNIERKDFDKLLDIFKKLHACIQQLQNNYETTPTSELNEKDISNEKIRDYWIPKINETFEEIYIKELAFAQMQTLYEQYKNTFIETKRAVISQKYYALKTGLCQSDNFKTNETLAEWCNNSKWKFVHDILKLDVQANQNLKRYKRLLNAHPVIKTASIKETLITLRDRYDIFKNVAYSFGLIDDMQGKYDIITNQSNTSKLTKQAIETNNLFNTYISGVDNQDNLNSYNKSLLKLYKLKRGENIKTKTEKTN